MKKFIRHIIPLFILCFVKLQVSFAQDSKWERFQTIQSLEQKIHSITFNNGILAINFNNEFIEVYRIINDQFELAKTYRLKWLWEEFGTMKLAGTYLYVSIDGYKYYKIDLIRDRIKKTNTYKAGFYIMSRYDVEYYGDYWILKINDAGDLEIWLNKKFKENYMELFKDTLLRKEK